jgi:capsular exopolysaccharide synthesis family protein
MTRRTQSESALTPAESLGAPVIAPVAGSAALDTTPFIDKARVTSGGPDKARSTDFTADKVRPTDFVADKVRSTDFLADKVRPTHVSAEITEPRTARATLHPALVAAIAPHSTIAERYRAVRTRLSMQEERGPLRSILVTSPESGDGKSVTAANLALTMAQEFQRNVVLVDANLRGASAHSLFGLDSTPGLADVLAGEASLDEALVYLPDYRLTLLPAGRTPQFPTELLGSMAMRRSIDLLRARFDRLLIDLPAVTPHADVGTVAPLADGVLLVVRAGITQRPALDEALAAFEEDKVVGVVLNDTH